MVNEHEFMIRGRRIYGIKWCLFLPYNLKGMKIIRLTYKNIAISKNIQFEWMFGAM